MKTAKEWFEQQPEPMRTVLLNCMDFAEFSEYDNLRLHDSFRAGLGALRCRLIVLSFEWNMIEGICKNIRGFTFPPESQGIVEGGLIHQISQQQRPIGSVLWYEQTKDGNPQWVWKVKGKEAEPLPIPDELPMQIAYISVSPDEYQRLKRENEQLRDANEANRKMAFALIDAGITTVEQLYDVIDRATAFSELNEAMKEWMREWEGRKNA